MASILNKGDSDAADKVPSLESMPTGIPAVETADSPAKAPVLHSPKAMAFTIAHESPSTNNKPIGITGSTPVASSSNVGRLTLPIGSTVQPAAAFTPFPQLSQSSDDAIKTLICRAWDAKNMSGKYLGTEYIISDEHGNAMHCIARSVIAHCVVPKLQVGGIYSIRRFTLEQNKDAYRVRRDDHFIIQLEANTVIDKLECSILGFMLQPFHLQPIEEIAFNGHKYVIDVVGRVINLDEWRATSNNSHYLYFHLINERKEVVPPPDNNASLRHLLMLGREQHGANEMQPITVKCYVKIVGIHPQSTWKYNSYGERGCKKGLKSVENKLYCDVCAKYCEFPLLRYRLRLQVSDETTTLVVTLFDEVAEALI